MAETGSQVVQSFTVDRYRWTTSVRATRHDTVPVSNIWVRWSVPLRLQTVPRPHSTHYRQLSKEVVFTATTTATVLEFIELKQPIQCLFGIRIGNCKMFERRRNVISPPGHPAQAFFNFTHTTNVRNPETTKKNLHVFLPTAETKKFFSPIAHQHTKHSSIQHQH